MARSRLVVAACVLLGAASIHAQPLTQARVTKLLNNVKLVDPVAGARVAELNDVVRDGIALKTGVKSRSELLFEDDTLTRIGPETIFRFTAGTRDMALDRGSMLLQVPKGIGGATIHTAAVTAAITGTTIMLENNPGKDVKVLVLEGSLRLSLDGKFGDSVFLTPGKMVVMPPTAKRIPEPVTVDLAGIVKTSSLVNMGGHKGKGALPSIALIEHAIADQTNAKGRSDLVETNYAINGRGFKAEGPASVIDMIAQHDIPVPASGQLPSGGHGIPTPAPSATPVSTPVATPIPTPMPTPMPTAPPEGDGHHHDDGHGH